MSRLEIVSVKTTLTSLASFIIYLIGTIDEVVIVLIFFMMLDFITGLFRAYVTKSLDSTLGIAGVIKKFSIIVMVGMAGGIEYIMISIGQDPRGVVLLAVSSFFVVNEGLSILENCAQIGLPIPPVMYNALEKLNRDPFGKEQVVSRDPVMQELDKQVLLKEIDELEQELKKENEQERGEK